MTAQCVNDGIRIKLGAVCLRMLDSVPDSLHVLLESVRDAGVTVRLLLLLDREFFSIDIIKILQGCDMPFLVPCKNTGNVVAALREFAQKRRYSSSISENILEGNKASVTHTTW